MSRFPTELVHEWRAPVPLLSSSVVSSGSSSSTAGASRNCRVKFRCGRVAPWTFEKEPMSGLRNKAHKGAGGSFRSSITCKGTNGAHVSFGSTKKTAVVGLDSEDLTLDVATTLTERPSLGKPGIAQRRGADLEQDPDEKSGKGFATIEEAVEAIREGKFVLVVDDENRENEGDLIMAGSLVTPQAMAFLVRHSTGIVCVSMKGEDLDRLGLPLMVPPEENSECMKTAFTWTVDAKHGTTTGVSASDRCQTIRALASSDSGPGDFVAPGHVFPLRYREGGVLKRRGHTEAALDLTELAGLRPAGVLCEVVNDEDGSMARLPYLMKFAQRHGFPLISIDALVKFKEAKKSVLVKKSGLVERTASARLPTEYGEFQVFSHVSNDGLEHAALVEGFVSCSYTGSSSGNGFGSSQLAIHAKNTESFSAFRSHSSFGWFFRSAPCKLQRQRQDITMERRQRGNLGKLIVCSVASARETTKVELNNRFPLEDVLEAQQFDRELLTSIFEVAREMEDIERDSTGSQLLKGYLMATLFYEPSTRTRLSFESAMKRLGGEVLTTENAREFSSAAKGETLEDSIRTVEGYSDIIVLRHFESGSAKKAAATANIPIINAGDGPGQHPTQALLDMYTIQRELGHLDNITVGLVGDLANGRTVRSLAYLLAKYEGVKIFFVAPDVVKMKDDIKDHLTDSGVHWEESADLMEVASKCDVIYQTRIQRERFGDRIDLYKEARGKYIVDTKVMDVLPKHGVILHPLPRLDEITVEVDSDPRAAYFRQAKNGLFIRMALLKLLLLGY